MFWRKAKTIERLREIVRLKETQRRAAHDAANEDKKRLAEVLRERAVIKKKLTRTEEALMGRIQEVEALELQLADAREEIRAVEENALRQRQKTYKACAKMRAAVKEQAQTIAVYQHNMEALMVTYEQSDSRNRELEGLCREQAGKLAVLNLIRDSASGVLHEQEETA